MKKFFAIALLITSAFVGSAAYAGVPEPTVNGMKKRAVGARESEPVRVFKLVRYGQLPTGVNSPSVASEDVLVYDTVSDDGISVAFTTSSHDNAVAGVAVTAIQTYDSKTGGIAEDQEGARNWGWIIVHGPAIAKVSTGAGTGIAVGAPWITSTDSGAVGYITSGSTSAVHYQGVGGFFFDTLTTETEAEVFVRLE